MSRLHIFMGLPFTGKTTFAKSLDLPHIEIDEVRKSLTGSFLPKEETASLVADVVYQSIHHYLSNQEEVIVEGLFLSVQSRELLIDLALQCEAEVYVYWFDPSLSWIKEKLATKISRKNYISLTYIEEVSNLFEFPTMEEGFDRFYYFTEKDFIFNKVNS